MTIALRECETDLGPPPGRRPLDPSRLAVLRELDPGGHHGLLAALLEAFREQATSDLVTIESAIEAGDATIVARRAHSLKGAAADVGATGVKEVCADLEANAAFLGRPALVARVAELHVEVDHARSAIEAAAAR
jgi:HPt (histidine-containing phosphotransfer) domain-containing protein